MGQVLTNNTGLQYAREKMGLMASEAGAIARTFPPSDARDALIDLIGFVVATAPIPGVNTPIFPFAGLIFLVDVIIVFLRMVDYR